ncbi:EamA family transporter [Siculibacillus lacustris]|uniref:EamA family transporter n=1 Tax=Siculibacillus lacustris TaxID=1549641 RepID=A0A4Q9VVT9_9HYPH|nr:EamA family transporter [Siculibacillus lacustris]TBW39960.1 EamA family transporter [Siculibacillus lacustris]
MTSRSLATSIGLTAIVMWASLGTLVAVSGRIPAFEMNMLTFGISGVAATVWLAATGRLGVLRQPLRVWALGVGGLFGYHALFFTALRLAPPVEANLVNYLWPLLIVLLSGLLPGERLRPHHLIGAALGLFGAGLVVTRGRGIAIDPADLPGYAAALASALTWAGYSVLSRRMGAVPTATVAGFCLATAVLSGVCHLIFETTVWPRGGVAWGAVVGLGVFPVGLAFFVWDHGVKRGDIQVLGAASYVTPLLSTLLLILAGWGEMSVSIGFAAVAITAGALIASWDVIRPASRKSRSGDA